MVNTGNAVSADLMGTRGIISSVKQFMYNAAAPVAAASEVVDNDHGDEPSQPSQASQSTEVQLSEQLSPQSQPSRQAVPGFLIAVYMCLYIL